MSEEQATFFDYLTAGAILGVEAVLRVLPMDIVAPALRGLGRTACRLDWRHRRLAEDQVRMAFGPAMGDADVRRIVREVYEHLAVSFAEVAQAERIFAGPAWRERVEVRGEEVLRALPPGRPVLFVSAHIGNWEVAGLSLARLGRPCLGIMRPLDNPILSRVITTRRARFGHRFHAKHGAVKEALRVLKAGGAVGMLADQNARRNPVFVDFFGRPAATVKTIGRLARETGALVVAGFPYRIPGTQRHCFELDPPLQWEPAEDPEEEIRRITQAYSDRVESWVRRFPGQYLWLHRRWRTRPGEEEPARMADTAAA